MSAKSLDNNQARSRQMIGGITVETFGPEDGPAILFSAGLGGAGSYWQPHIPAFARDYQIILYDHRGTGGSSRDALPTPYSVSHMAEDMGLLLDGLSIQTAHVVGHAAGGVAGLALALRTPSRVASLTVVNGWAVADPHFVRCFEIRRAIYETGGPDAYLKAQPLFLYPAEWISEHLAELDAERVRHLPAFQDRATLFARMDALAAFDMRDGLASVQCPCLVIGTVDDMLVPSSAAQALADGLPTVALEMLPWGGHAVNITAQSRFESLLSSFLRLHPDRT